MSFDNFFEEVKEEFNYEEKKQEFIDNLDMFCLLYTSPSPRDATLSRMPSSA